jgi:hypothetical protein
LTKALPEEGKLTTQAVGEEGAAVPKPAPMPKPGG